MYDWTCHNWIFKCYIILKNMMHNFSIVHYLGWTTWVLTKTFCCLSNYPLNLFSCSKFCKWGKVCTWSIRITKATGFVQIAQVHYSNCKLWFICSNIPAAPVHGVYIYISINTIFGVCILVRFLNGGLLLFKKLLAPGLCQSL